MARPRTIVFTAAGLLLGLLVLALGAVAAATQTARGRELLRTAAMPLVRAAVPGTVYIGTVSGTLFTGVSVDSLDIRAPDGTPFLTTGPVELEYDPRDLLDRRIVIRRATVTRPVIQLVDYGNDDWNWKRALRKPNAAPAAPNRNGFGAWIRVDSLEVHEGTMSVVEPWLPVDSLRGVRRDSAIAFNLARRDLEIRREDDRLVKVRRWMRAFVALGPSRIAHPDSAGLRFAVRRLDAVESDPPFWFRNTSATVRLLQDTAWIDDGRIHLANSGGAMEGKIVWGGGLPMRWDLRIRGDSVAFSDIAWIDPVLPHIGGGETELHIRNNANDVRVMEYVITDMDARAFRSRLRGRMTFAVGGPVLRISSVGLDLSPVHTDLLRWMNAEPFPYDWQGAITGRVSARGGPVTRFFLDNATLTYTDAHVPGAVTKGVLTGPLNVYEPALAVFQGAELDLERLDLRTPRYVNPLFAELNGFIAGTMRLDSVWTDVRFSEANLRHYDGPGDTSRVTGSGRVLLLDNGTYFDVRMSAAPLSFTTMAKSYPSLPTRGYVVGPIRAQGTVEDFSLATALAGAGGEIAFNGSIDAFEPDFRATGELRVSGADARVLFADTLLPRSFVGFTADLDVSGASTTTLQGSASARLSERSTSVGDIRVFSGQAGVRFTDGRLMVDSLSLESAAFRARASGALGLTADTRDTLRVRLDADSLGGLREVLRAAGQLGDRTLATLDLGADSIERTAASGTLALQAIVAASLDTLDSVGVHVDLTADARDVSLGTSAIGRAQLTATVDDALRRARGSGRLLLDSVQVAGVDAEAIVAEASLDDGIVSQFDVAVRTPTAATLAMTGDAERVGDSIAVTITRFDARTPGAPTRAFARALVDTSTRGFSLARPVRILWGDSASGRLDSLVLQHSDRGRLTVAGALGADGTVSGVLRAEAVPLQDLGALLRPEAPWTGTVASDFSVSGSRDAPELSGTIALRDATFGAIRLGELDATARYASERMLADLSLVVDGQPAVTATASLPLDLALRQGRQRLLDEPLTGRLTSEAVDLAALEAIVPSLQDGVGQLDTDIALTGSWDRPRLAGQLSINDGGLTLERLGTRLEQLSADIRLAGDTIDIRRLAAQSGEGRTDTMALSGRILIEEIAEPEFDVRLSANAFLAIDRAREATLAITTEQPVTLRGPLRAATLEGAMRVNRGRIFLNSLSQRRALDLSEDLNLIDTTTVRMDALLAQAPNAIVQGLSLQNVRLDIGDDVWLRSPEANIKLGGGLRLTRALDIRDGRARLALSDSLTVQRGTYQLNLGLARPTFDVERGTIRFFGDPDLDPALDIAALHIVRQQRLNSNRQDVRIRVQMGGTLSSPTLTLSSADNPPLPESDMLSYLVTGEPAYALFGTTYADQGATLALRLASSYLSTRLAGGRFDLVQVEPTALNPGEASNLRESGLGILAATRVGVGGQVGRRTFLSVTTGLCGLAPQGSGSADPLSLFAQGLGVKLERQFDSRFSAALGIEPGSSAQTCGRPGVSRTFQQTPPQIGLDFFRSWSW